MLKGIDHVGIAVKDLDEATSLYRDVLGFKLDGVHVIPEQKIKVAFFFSGGETRVELLASLSSDSTIAKFIENRGEGIHHFAIKVENVEAVLEKLKGKGVTLIDEKPRIGAQGVRIAFIHPKSTRGVLLEFVEKP